MSGARFGIINAVRNGFIFVGQERHYLLRTGMLPLGATILLSVFLNKITGPIVSVADMLHAGLISLPVDVMLAWYVFIIARLALAGERMDKLPADQTALKHRRDLMQACILSYMLIDIGSTLLRAGLSIAVLKNAHAQNGLLTFATMMLIGGFLWAVRFAAAPALLAVGQSVKKYIFRVNGFGISLRLGALWLFSVVPVMLTVLLIASAFLPDKLQTPQTLAKILNAFSPLGDYVSATLFFSSLCFALREMMGIGPAQDARGGRA